MDGNGAQERERLETLSRYEIVDTGEEPAFDDLAAIAREVCDAPISLISFLDGEREWFKSNVGSPLREVPRDHAFASRIIRKGEFVVVPDATKDDELRENPLVRDKPHLRFFAGCPLIDDKGHVLGAFYVADSEPHQLNARQQQMLGLLSHEAMMLLELRHEVRENQKRNALTSAELEAMRVRLEAEAAEHRDSEQKLKRREQQLADAQRITHLGSWEWDLHTNAVAWSDELYRIYGLEPEQFEATYASYLDHVHPDDRLKVNQAVERALLSKGSFASEERIVRADGTIRVLSSRGEVILNEKGEPVRMVGCCHDITERKQIENDLQHSLSLLHATIESTADGILVVDLNGNIIRFNQKFLELWHLPAEVVRLYDDRRLLGIVVEQMKSPEEFLAKVKSLYQSPEAESTDVLEFKDGRTFERFSCPQRLGREIVGRVWSFRDVTDRCRALAILRHSEERYRSLVTATAQVVWTTDPRGDAMEDGASWREFTGQTSREVKNRGWLNAIHPRDRRRVAETWDHAVATGTVYEVEFEVRRADGQWSCVATRGVPVREPDGSIREWVGCCVDITEQRNAEQIILKERDFSHAMINSLPGIFYLLDETGLNLRWNENLEKVSGYSLQEITGMRAIDFVPQEEKLILAERVRQVFTAGEAELQLSLLTKAGKRIPYYCTGKLVHLDGVPRLIGMGIDISELKHAQNEIKRLNSDLERRVQERTSQLNAANKELETFIYTASHDLRSPIRAMAGFARAIKEDSLDALDEEHRLYLERIIQAGDRMMLLIDDLLNYCRVGRQAIRLQPISLLPLLREVAADFTARLKSSGGEVSIASTLPDIVGDRLSN